jgi:site-specific recombinase XerC
VGITLAYGDGRLNPRVINTVFNEVCSLAGVEGHTPHDTRHAMGRHLIEKTGNITAVQHQLGHTNAAYSIQYARVTEQDWLTHWMTGNRIFCAYPNPLLIEIV